MTPIDPARFDDAARALHAQALGSVSARTTADLHRRRHAALRQEETARRPLLPRWLATAAFASAAMAALGLGLVLRQAAPDEAPSSVAIDAAASGIEDTLAELEEHPDFFLWLASSDASLLAME